MIELKEGVLIMNLFSSYKFKLILAVVALIFVVVIVIAFASIQMIEMNAMQVFHERSQIAMEQAAQFMDVEKIKELAKPLMMKIPIILRLVVPCGMSVLPMDVIIFMPWFLFLVQKMIFSMS